MKMVESIRNNTVEKKQQKTNRYVNIHLEKEHEAGSDSLSDIIKKVILIVTDSLELPYCNKKTTCYTGGSKKLKL